MDIPRDHRPIRWRLHLASPPEKVHGLLATDEGRARFWAESALEQEGNIEFRFSNGLVLRAKVLSNVPPSRFALTYFGGSVVTIDLASDGKGGTDLTLVEAGVPAGSWEENRAGWLSVLLALKAAADFSVDLRNHDPNRSWDQGYADN